VWKKEIKKKGKMKYMEINKYINIDTKKRRTKMGHIYLPRYVLPDSFFDIPERIETSLSTDM
jgi:hypothetical protein